MQIVIGGLLGCFLLECHIVEVMGELGTLLVVVVSAILLCIDCLALVVGCLGILTCEKIIPRDVDVVRLIPHQLARFGGN